MKMKKHFFTAILAFFLVFQTILAPISTTMALAVGNNDDIEVENKEALEEGNSKSKENEEKEQVKDIIKDIDYTNTNNENVEVDEHEGEIKAHVTWSAQNKENLSKYEETRSEEHTSELQSRGHLVCRLLLEQKKMHS